MSKESNGTYYSSVVLYTPIGLDKEKGDKKKQNMQKILLNNDIFPHCKTDTKRFIYLDI